MEVEAEEGRRLCSVVGGVVPVVVLAVRGIAAAEAVEARYLTPVI